MNAAQKSHFYRELGKLVTANFHLDRSLELLLSQNPGSATRRLLLELQKSVLNGQRLSDGMAASAAAGVQLGKLDLALIEAGEHSGKLGDSLKRLAEYYAELHTAVVQARSALIYPLILLHLGVVLPLLPKLFAEGLGAAEFGRQVLAMLGLFWAVLLVLWRLWIVAVNRARYSAAWDRSLGWLPFIGKMRACWASARFSRVGHAGLLAGLNPHHWVRLASSASGSGRFHEGGLQAAETIGTGEAIALSLRRSGGFPAPLVDRLDTAEQIGELDHELQRLAEEKTEDARQATRRAAEWLPKIAYALVALIVAWQIVKTFMAIYQPVFDLL